MKSLTVVALSMRFQMRNMLAAWKFTITIGAIQPTVLLLIMLAARSNPTPSQTSAAATGVLLTTLWNSTVWNGAGILRWERAEGTLGATMCAVRDPRLVLIGKSLGSGIYILSNIFLSMAIVLAITHHSVTVKHPIWYVVGVVMALTTGVAMGLLLGCLFVLTRYGAQLSAALAYPVFLTAGLLIPQSMIPSWARPIGSLVSLRWIQQFLTSAAGSDLDVSALSVAAVLTAAYAVIGTATFSWVSQLARSRGSIELG